MYLHPPVNEMYTSKEGIFSVTSMVQVLWTIQNYHYVLPVKLFKSFERFKMPNTCLKCKGLTVYRALRTCFKFSQCLKSEPGHRWIFRERFLKGSLKHTTYFPNSGDMLLLSEGSPKRMSLSFHNSERNTLGMQAL